MQCKKCGTELPVGSKVCPYCGEPAPVEGDFFHTGGDLPSGAWDKRPEPVEPPAPVEAPAARWEPPAVETEVSCFQCGAKLAPNSVFCKVCGARQTAVTEEPKPVIPVPTPPVPPEPSLSLGRAAFRDAFGSALALVTAIVVSLVCLLNLVSAFQMGSNSLIAQALDTMGLPWGMVSTLQNWMVVIGLISAIPSILMTVSAWLVFAGARDARRYRLAGSGLMINKVLVIISLVFLCIVLVVAEIALIVTLGFLGDSDATGIFILVMLILALFGAGVIACYVVYIRALDAMRETALTGRAANGPFLPPAVICFVVGGMYAISLLLTMVLQSMMTILSMLCAIAELILFGIILCVYRGRINQALGRA